MDIKNTLYKACKENIEDFDLLEKHAFAMMDKMRCPLSMASSELYNAMEEVVADYCDDNKLDADDYDIEDIFWAGEGE